MMYLFYRCSTLDDLHRKITWFPGICKGCDAFLSQQYMTACDASIYKHPGSHIPRQNDQLHMTEYYDMVWFI